MLLPLLFKGNGCGWRASAPARPLPGEGCLALCLLGSQRLRLGKKALSLDRPCEPLGGGLGRVAADPCLPCAGHPRYSLPKGALPAGSAAGGARSSVELEPKMIDDLLFPVFHRFCFPRRHRWSRLELTMPALREARARGQRLGRGDRGWGAGTEAGVLGQRWGMGTEPAS